MLECRACVEIPAGSPITTHYVSPLLDVNTRLNRLKEKWFFDCNCSRCNDSSGMINIMKFVICVGMNQFEQLYGEVSSEKSPSMWQH